MYDVMKTSGLPITADDNGQLTFGEGMRSVTADIRHKKDMLDVLYNANGNGPEELYYMYRNVCREQDRAVIEKHGLRYDVTV